MQNHTSALEALIKSIPALAKKTFVLTAPKGTVAPYVILHPSDGVDKQTRFTGPKSTQFPRFTLHTVGVDYDQCAAAAKLIKDKLVVNGRGVTLTVPGEVTQPVWFSAPIPIQVDNDITPPLIWHTAEVGFRADPLP